MLDAVKLYLRVDHNYEDDLIQSLINAALSFIKMGTGVDVVDSNEKGMLIVKILVSHWYENRQMIGQTECLPYSVTALLLQIEAERDKT